MKESNDRITENVDGVLLTHFSPPASVSVTNAAVALTIDMTTPMSRFVAPTERGGNRSGNEDEDSQANSIGGSPFGDDGR